MPKRANKPNKLKKPNNLVIFAISFISVFLIAFLGSLFTSTSVDSDWYESIKPSITPPNYIFPIVWTILFFLIALSLYFALINSKKQIFVASIFGINLLFNLLWSLFYFKMRAPLLAFIDIIFIWLTIIFMMIVTFRIDKKAFWLLWPYLLWVSFAAVLNFLSI